MVAPKQPSPQGDITINKDSLDASSGTVAGWQWAIRTMYRLEFTRKEALQKLGAWQTLSSDLAPAEDGYAGAGAGGAQ